ncbi:MAG: hypothetical protein EBR82_60685 [Caulobacteraceae bacterium]|nr:hypothetical protein [Caulobacteraceae bacterium]
MFGIAAASMPSLYHEPMETPPYPCSTQEAGSKEALSRRLRAAHFGGWQHVLVGVAAPAPQIADLVFALSLTRRDEQFPDLAIRARIT